MGVKFQRQEYTDMVDRWKRCEDVAAGQDTIHASGTKYLPKLADQTNEDYDAYKNRTPFYNATWRTIVGLQGMLFRKPPTVQVPPKVEPMLQNITLDGTPLHIFALELSEECLKLGRVGVFVDFPEVDVVHATAADAKAGNYRPLLKMYKAGTIINWKTKTVNNATVLSMVVLTECAAIPVDEFEDKEQTQYRVLDLIDIIDPVTGVVKSVYRVRVFIVKEDAGKEVDALISTTYPMIDGEVLDYIPFQFIGVDDVDSEIDEPPLIDLVDMNLMHYRVSADYEHGCHFTGLPTPVISGYTPEAKGEKFYIGSMTAWVFPNANATATYLEFKGDGLNALEKNLARKEGQMAILGARMLEVSRGSGVESADTAAIHRGGEQSMLSSVAQAISIGVEKALTVFCKFAGADPTVKFSLNRDFFPVPMDSLTITALIAGWQNQAYSYQTLFDNLQRGEVISLDVTAQSEQAAIKANPPPLIDAPTTPGNVVNQKPKTGSGSTGENPTITQLQHGTAN